MNIYPSILEDNLERFTAQFTKLSPFFTHFQIDIADGIFVPHKTVQIEELTEWSKTVDTNKTFEFHLMVADAQMEIEKIKNLSSNITITQVLIPIQPLTSTLPLGVVLNPEDQVMTNLDTIKLFNTAQIMTVHPGAQGTPFMLEMLTKINELRDNGFTGDIILDGGINNETLPIILNNKHVPTAVCPGSYLHEDTENRLKILQNISQ